jgi:hypothetical protein
MNTQNTPKIEQWMRDLAETWYLMSEDNAKALAECIAKHAPPSPAELPSIWRPVSQRPTKEDGDESMCVVMYGSGMVWDAHWSHAGAWPEAHWCSTADFLERCPLPKEKTQEEEDRDKARSLWEAYSPSESESVTDVLIRAIAHGRATAKTEGGK